VLRRLALRIRARSAASRALLPAAVLLSFNLFGVLTLKISGAEPGPLTAPACTALAVAACAAVFGLLWALGMTFNIFSFIGIIMLTGMATKNAILMVDYSNVLVRRGRSLMEAAREAASIRFRPVVMTTLSTVLGMMPIAFGYGAGGEARAPLGVAVAAGLLATTGLTLIIIPVVYTLVDTLQQKVLGRIRRQGAGR